MVLVAAGFTAAQRGGEVAGKMGLSVVATGTRQAGQRAWCCFSRGHAGVDVSETRSSPRVMLAPNASSSGHSQTLNRECLG